VSTTITLDELYRPIEDALVHVREGIGQLWTDALTLVNLEGTPSPRTGGKMLRPALCLMAAGAIGAKDLKRYARLSTAFEALHIASLAHDDVIDRALLRRGKTSLNGLWDNHAAVLGGDYLVARAVEILAAYDSCEVVANAITSVRRMAEGELFFFNRPEGAVNEQDCIMLAEQKTASLFAEACSAPTYIIDPTHRAALHRFGTSLGIAFQLVDDLLDVTQTTDRLGKPSCGDVSEGKQTLPIMHMRANLQGADADRLEGYRDAELTEADREWIIGKAEETGAGEVTFQKAKAYADDALENVRTLPPSDYRASMEGIVEFVLVRAY
jgi:octaprenyl-diphosphate synthase